MREFQSRILPFPLACCCVLLAGNVVYRAVIRFRTLFYLACDLDSEWTTDGERERKKERDRERGREEMRVESAPPSETDFFGEGGASW